MLGKSFNLGSPRLRLDRRQKPIPQTALRNTFKVLAVSKAVEDNTRRGHDRYSR
jgi:hypothetical protein